MVFLIIFHLFNYTLPLWQLWSRINVSFRCTLSLFMATYRNSLYRYCRLWSLFMSRQLKNRFFEAKRLCQGIKHCFVVCISLWQIKNRYKEMNVIRSIFYRYNACNLHRGTHDNGGWRRFSMVFATERNIRKKKTRETGRKESFKVLKQMPDP